MTDKHERLLRLDNDKLIDVVKNFRQYGYDEQIRENAISILEARGISKEQLQITGNFENKSYDYANDLHLSFQKNSKIAFFMYLIMLITRILKPIIPFESELLAITFLLIPILAFILYFVFLIRSFMNQNQFYKLIGQDYGTEGALLYLFLGMPFYLVMFFYFRNQMQEKINEIK